MNDGILMGFAEHSVVVREVCNGVLALSALALVCIFGCYVHRRWRTFGFKNGDELLAAQAASAITLLLVGHFIRSFLGWMQFVWADLGWPADNWTNASEYFIIATILILAGKWAMVYIFGMLRWPMLLLLALGIFSVPVALAVLIAVIT